MLPKREPGKAYRDAAGLDETQEIDMGPLLDDWQEQSARFYHRVGRLFRFVTSLGRQWSGPR